MALDGLPQEVCSSNGGANDIASEPMNVIAERTKHLARKFQSIEADLPTLDGLLRAVSATWIDCVQEPGNERAVRSMECLMNLLNAHWNKMMENADICKNIGE